MKIIVLLFICFLLLNCINSREQASREQANLSVSSTEIENIDIDEPIILSINLPARNLLEAVHYGDISFVQRYIKNFNHRSRQHLSFSNSDLRLLRNTIFAKHGQIFRSRDLQEHFQRFAWYSGTKENVEQYLTENELRLIRVILAMEAANPPTREDLVGSWFTTVPASVEYIGFVPLYLGADGRMWRSDGSYWFFEGSTFSVELDDWHWSFPSGGNEYLRIIIFEYNGELYKATHFDSGWSLWFQHPNRPPISFFGNPDHFDIPDWW